MGIGVSNDCCSVSEVALNPVDMRRNNNAIITLKRCHNVVLT